MDGTVGTGPARSRLRLAHRPGRGRRQPPACALGGGPGGAPARGRTIRTSGPTSPGTAPRTRPERSILDAPGVGTVPQGPTNQRRPGGTHGTGYEEPRGRWPRNTPAGTRGTSSRSPSRSTAATWRSRSAAPRTSCWSTWPRRSAATSRVFSLDTGRLHPGDLPVPREGARRTTSSRSRPSSRSPRRCRSWCARRGCSRSTRTATRSAAACARSSRWCAR